MRKFCEDEGYDSLKFCRYARSGQAELNVKTGGDGPGFIEVNPDGYICYKVFDTSDGDDLTGLLPCYCTI